MDLIHALGAQFGLDRVSGTLLVLGTRIDRSSFGGTTQQHWAFAVIQLHHRLLSLGASLHWIAGSFFAGGAATLAFVLVNDDSVAFGTFYLRLFGALLLLTSVSGAAAVIDFFADEFEASLVASRRGLAGDQGLRFAAARVSASSDEVFARFTDVGVVIFAWFVFILWAAAFVDFLYSIDGRGHGASFLVLAGFLDASRHDRFALFAVDHFAFSALVLLAFFAVCFLLLADPLFASAFHQLIALNGLLAFVAVQLLYGLFFRHASISWHAGIIWERVWFAIFCDDIDGGDGEFMALVAFRRR